MSPSRFRRKFERARRVCSHAVLRSCARRACAFPPRALGALAPKRKFARSMLRVACGATGLIGTVMALERLETLPTAYHEAGHSIVAHHLAQRALTPRGHVLAPAPQLRFTTIVPRVTDKGVRYAGETKLVVRWRDLEVQRQEVPISTADAQPMLQLPPPPPSDGMEPHAYLSVARIAYLFGGRVAEDTLRRRTGVCTEQLVEELLRPVDDNMNVHKQKQLRELALINGTLRDENFCNICGEPGHRQYECPSKQKVRGERRKRGWKRRRSEKVENR